VCALDPTIQLSGQYSNYTHAQQQPQPSTNPSDQVKYRFYYKQAQEFRQAAVSPVVSPSDKEEWLRKSKWSEYYSGQAYYGKPGVPDIQTTVPPAPGVSTAATQQQQQVASSRSMHDIPDSLKRYVQAMLRQCKTDAEKKVAQDMVQRVIQNAVKTSTLWSTNWDERIPESDPASAAEKQSVPFPVPPQPISSIPPPPPPPKGPSVAQTASILPRSHASNLSQSNGAASSPNQAWSVTANDSYYCPVDKVTARDSYYGPTDVSLSSSPKKKKQKKVLAVVKTAVIGFDIASDTMAARANRFSTDLGKGKKKNRSVEQEVGRFMGMGVVGGHSSSKMMDQSEYEKMTVKGTCQTLEKGYLRLTAPPKAELVRPEPVLQKHLHNLKKLWAKKKRDYAWMCSQLKALRQDLTVQRINNPLTVDVYETHARIALEESDLNEYNQCQTQLKELYAKLQKEGDPKGLKNLCEFLAYRLIYFVFLTLNKKYEGGSSDLLNMMLSLTTEQKLDRCIGHALKGKPDCFKACGLPNFSLLLPTLIVVSFLDQSALLSQNATTTCFSNCIKIRRKCLGSCLITCYILSDSRHCKEL
jgi:hypothetical protein